MDRTEALKAARKRWGKSGHIQESDRPSSQEERDKARTEWRALREQPEPSDPTERRARRKELGRLHSIMLHYRFSVGKLMTVGPFPAFHVIGYGDNWAEAFRKADAPVRK